MPANCIAKLSLLFPLLRSATEAPSPVAQKKAAEAAMIDTIAPITPKKPS